MKYQLQIFLSIVILIIQPTNLKAQWEQTNGPHTEMTLSLATGINSTGDTLLYAGTYEGCVFMTANYGSNWTEIDGGNISIGDTGFTKRNIDLLVANQNGRGGIDLYASCSSGVFHTSNNGANWTKVDSLIGYHDFVISHNTQWDTILFKIDINNCLIRSINNGVTWEETTISSAIPNCLAVYDSIVYVGIASYNSIVPSYSYEIYFSLDGGLHWLFGGSPAHPLNAIAVCGSYLFTGISMPFEFSGSVWRRPLSQIMTFVENRGEHIPRRYVLEQNYPNPFNPSTTISFSLPAKSYVVLKVYDMLGKEVATLIQKELSSGNHIQQWNASNVSSGVYFYRLEAGVFMDTKKLILLR
jgi:hypothetical protein